MNQKGSSSILVIILLVIIAAGGIYIFLNRNIQQPVSNNITATTQPTSTTIPTPTLTPTPTDTVEEVSNIPSGWLTYTNTEYGFEIYYPSTYSALDDEDNLYGWPKGIVLIYKGGQSYDLAIEYWSNVAEYEAKYQNQLTNLTIKNMGGQYITLLNTNGVSEVNEIIQTFKIIQ